MLTILKRFKAFFPVSDSKRYLRVAQEHLTFETSWSLQFCLQKALIPLKIGNQEKHRKSSKTDRETETPVLTFPMRYINSKKNRFIKQLHHAYFKKCSLSQKYAK